jgi:hypothetical protein
MKIHLAMKILLAALVASVAFAAPADAASKKKKKTYHRAQVGAVQYNGSNDVYFGNTLVGRDPDSSIRAFMRRGGPQPWDGPE